jgi:hypothetical protein
MLCLGSLGCDLGLVRRTSGEMRLPDRRIMPSSDGKSSDLGQPIAASKVETVMTPEDRQFILSRARGDVLSGLGYRGLDDLA